MPSKLIDRSKAKNRGIMPSKLIDRSKAKNRGIMPSKLIDRSKAKNRGSMPSKLIDRSKAKNRGSMPSKLIGPPIIRWKEKKKQKHQYLLYQTKHHSHQLIIKYSCYVVILCHYSSTLSHTVISQAVGSHVQLRTCP